MIINEIDKTNRQIVNDFIINHWYTLEMVVRGESIDLGNADGFFFMQNEKISGLITYRYVDAYIEILSLDSMHEKQGIGTALLNRVIDKARKENISSIKLITTNDNMLALRFYQKRGFNMINLYCNAVDLAREKKPEIPLLGNDNIPIKHEIELEFDTNAI